MQGKELTMKLNVLIEGTSPLICNKFSDAAAGVGNKTEHGDRPPLRIVGHLARYIRNESST